MKGVVVAPQARAVEAGARALETGGNAFDAAIATAFMQMVVDPFMGSPGGMGTANVYVAATRENTIIDFHARAGSKARPDMWMKDFKGYSTVKWYSMFDDDRSQMGHTCVMTPGTIAGLSEIHRSYGTMPWGDLIEPAIKMARDGFKVPAHLTRFLDSPGEAGVVDAITKLKANPACGRIYLGKDSKFLQVGALLRNKDMAKTLEILAKEGPDALYHGTLARAIVKDFKANKGYITEQDLASYKPRRNTPLMTTYRGYKITSNLPPGGGPGVIELLNILEGFPLGKLDHNGPEHLNILIRAMQVMYGDRSKYLGDPDFVKVPLDRIFLSKEYAKKKQQAIKEGRVRPPKNVGGEGGTTNLCVIDAANNVIDITHTIGNSSGVVTPGLGFMYNNSMKFFHVEPGRANSIAPGKARTTGMCPTIVFKGGKPVFTAGAPGGAIIITSVLQSICNLIDFGMTAVEAVSAPRIHCQGAVVFADTTIRSDTCEALRKMGHHVEQQMVGSFPQVARIRADGSLDGGSDPRAEYVGIAYARG
ncbi:MAG: gamma-glutamyltransferase [Chloroflexota bacterium]